MFNFSSRWLPLWKNGCPRARPWLQARTLDKARSSAMQNHGKKRDFIDLTQGNKQKTRKNYQKLVFFATNGSWSDRNQGFDRQNCRIFTKSVDFYPKGVWISCRENADITNRTRVWSTRNKEHINISISIRSCLPLFTHPFDDWSTLKQPWWGDVTSTTFDITISYFSYSQSNPSVQHQFPQYFENRLSL